MSEENKPTGFSDLKPTELYRSAIEDFALVVDEADKNKKKVLLAAFVEGGVEWSDYVAQHPEVAPEEPEYVPSAANQVQSPQVEPTNKWAEDDVEEAPVVHEVVTATAPVQNKEATYLIKMTRENPLFEVRGYKFTQEHPYALVNAKDAEYILAKEDGFRQAFPSELEEFYG